MKQLIPYSDYDQENVAVTAHFGEICSEVIAQISRAVEQDGSRLLIHCHAGASRSPAFALAAICLRDPTLSARQAFDALLDICVKPWPNRRVVEELSRTQNMPAGLLCILDEYRSAHPKRILAYRVLNRKRGIVSPVSR